MTGQGRIPPAADRDPGEGDGAPACDEQWMQQVGSGAKKRSGLQIPGGGSLMLVGLFLAGIAGLYLLSLSSAPAAASADQRLAEARVDSVLLELGAGGGPGGADNPEGLDAVERFYHDSRSRQIPLADLRTNPFVFKVPPNMRTPVVDPGRPKAAAKKPAASSEWKQARAAAEKMRLQSILSGAHGKVAMISNNLLTEGQRIDGWTVIRIQPRSVTLRWRRRTFVLKMPQ